MSRKPGAPPADVVWPVQYQAEDSALAGLTSAAGTTSGLTGAGFPRAPAATPTAATTTTTSTSIRQRCSRLWWAGVIARPCWGAVVRRDRPSKREQDGHPGQHLEQDDEGDERELRELQGRRARGDLVLGGPAEGRPAHGRVSGRGDREAPRRRIARIQGACARRRPWPVHRSSARRRGAASRPRPPRSGTTTAWSTAMVCRARRSPARTHRWRRPAPRGRPAPPAGRPARGDPARGRRAAVR